MALAPGTPLGPYEILAPLGAGGMGEVYHARDTRLGRDVAVKILPSHQSPSREDRARFQREARAISALNHPHICVLHDIGREGDTDYLVMELVEGETLSRRLARSPLPTPELLRLGAQIADALDRAHRAGVVHRDLKPGNIMLTRSGAKLMDFGLALAAEPVKAGGLTATAPALGESEEPITAKGMVVGTLRYMAPEQLEGKPADPRSDIWAMGCVLYEMATGKPAFDATHAVSLISMIMRDQPREMAERAPMAPPALDRLVRQCLAKDPDDRWQTAGDLKRELEWIVESGSRQAQVAPVMPGRSSRAWRVGALVGAAVIAVAFSVTLLRPRGASKPMVFELSPPASMNSGPMANAGLPRISPNGTTLAFNATDSSGVRAIWLRPANSLEMRRLSGTEGAGRPFWSPDSKWLGFFVPGRLMKVDVNGGSPITVCEEEGADGTWSPRGVILFDGDTRDSIRMVRDSGGTPVGAARREAPGGSSWPQFLPDGRHFLYIGYQGENWQKGTLKVGSIDGHETKVLGPADSRVEYANGYLLYVREGTLFARPFDPKALRFKGDPIAVARDIEAETGGAAQFSASSEGTLVYHSGASPGTTSLVWLNRKGERVGTVGAPGTYDQPALSSDGTQLAVAVGGLTRSRIQIWLWDLARGLGRPFSVLRDEDTPSPVWSPDGSQVLYDCWPGKLLVQSVDNGTIDTLYESSDRVMDAGGWSADGQWILFMSYLRSEPEVNIDILAIPANGHQQPVPIVATRAWDIHPALSRDGKWLAYASNESGQWEIYVQPFGGHAAKWRISTQGGRQPSWRADGRELYYLALDGGLMSVAVGSGTSPHFSLPQQLFKAPGRVRRNTRNQYAPTRDGQKFLFVAPEGKETIGTTKVAVNWPALLASQ